MSSSAKWRTMFWESWVRIKHSTISPIKPTVSPSPDTPAAARLRINPPSKKPSKLRNRRYLS
ncbi:hypothetical protein DSO57_1012810 [Entomophthora muscae]|uniref:Uncharacterized protein n=1 Tax=Entomophthora muscae TaxID=34485 RepID=A0ACC2USY5_9FUNG|nr:hypothetical protein DSO57_1012810 [Entomophthora muscae]